VEQYDKYHRILLAHKWVLRAKSHRVWLALEAMLMNEYIRLY
jgi:hypothetical protein